MNELSTHIDTLGILVDALQEKGANIVLAERSGMGNTRKALEETGVLDLAKNRGIKVVNLDELMSSDWIRIKKVYFSPIVTLSILSPIVIFPTTSWPSMTCPNIA